MTTVHGVEGAAYQCQLLCICNRFLICGVGKKVQLPIKPNKYMTSWNINLNLMVWLTMAIVCRQEKVGVMWIKSHRVKSSYREKCGMVCSRWINIIESAALHQNRACASWSFIECSKGYAATDNRCSRCNAADAICEGLVNHRLQRSISQRRVQQYHL